ncbi:hypothetical protein BGZ96_001036 [Linnemannia gamsii]|uniref:RNI-like protein n=1 Tax=Linnemannia gamsii TaxID=64522 RepID=A0ABQ7K9H2_9FUNG|nr:hypothetical protein BGZ96_001036 [Linnemannia gamsii]
MTTLQHFDIAPSSNSITAILGIIPVALVTLFNFMIKIFQTHPLDLHEIRSRIASSLGFKDLAIMANLTLITLSMRGNLIDDSEAITVSEVLKTNSTLTTLSLKRVLIGNEGAVALSVALKTNLTLTTLNLEGNPIGPNGVDALSEVLRTNSILKTLKL